MQSIRDFSTYSEKSDGKAERRSSNDISGMMFVIKDTRQTCKESNNNTQALKKWFEKSNTFTDQTCFKVDLGEEYLVEMFLDQVPTYKEKDKGEGGPTRMP